MRAWMRVSYGRPRVRCHVCSSGALSKPPLISAPPRPSSGVDLLGPPVKEGGRADEGWLGLERDAALGLRLLQLLDAGEMAVDQRRVGERPQVLRRLELRGVG